MNEEISMDIPTDFHYDVVGNKVCKLRKAFYGVKQMARAWFGRFSNVMIGFSMIYIHDIIMT